MDQDVWSRGDGHLAQGVRMAAAAIASAALTATLVIAVGHSMIERQAPRPVPTDALLIRTGG